MKENFECLKQNACRGKDFFPGDEPAREGIADAQATQTYKTIICLCRHSSELARQAYHQGSWTLSFHNATRGGACRGLTHNVAPVEVDRHWHATMVDPGRLTPARSDGPRPPLFDVPVYNEQIRVSIEVIGCNDVGSQNVSPSV